VVGVKVKLPGESESKAQMDYVCGMYPCKPKLCRTGMTLPKRAGEGRNMPLDFYRTLWQNRRRFVR